MAKAAGTFSRMPDCSVCYNKGNRQADRQTQDNCCNPCCACAPRVNYSMQLYSSKIEYVFTI